jgi:putative sigma-54 modulation protein
MNINIQGSSSFTISQRISDYIAKRMEKLDFFKDHISDVVFHLESEKHIYRVSATLSIKKFGVNKFEATADEMYTAIDKIIHKMDVKINKEKTRIQDHSKAGHEEMVNFFDEHEKNQPEPTKNIPIAAKPTTLTDAYLQMKLNENDFYGLLLIEEDKEDSNVAPAFIRKLDDDILYLFKKKDNNTYIEYSLKTLKGDNIKENKKIRDIDLRKMSLLDAQKDILDQDYPFNLFINENDKVNFLFKESNGKWKLIS